MGNKNRRNSSTSSMMSVPSSENLDPKDTDINTGSGEQFNLHTGSNNSTVQKIANGLEDLAARAPNSMPSRLGFKSFKTGTLVTKNGQPSLVAVPDMSYLLSASRPRKNGVQSKLSPTTPAFVPKMKIPTGPKNPNIHYTRAHAAATAQTKRTGSTNFQKVQDLLQGMRNTGSNQKSKNYNCCGGGAVQQPARQQDSRVMSIPDVGGVSYGSSGLYGGAVQGRIGYDNSGYSGAVQGGAGYGNSGYGAVGYHNNGFGNMGSGNISSGCNAYGSIQYGSNQVGYDNSGYGQHNTGPSNIGYRSPSHGAIARDSSVYGNLLRRNYGQSSSDYDYDSPGPSNMGSGYATPTQITPSYYANPYAQAPMGMDTKMGSCLAMAKTGSRSSSEGTVIHQAQLRKQHFRTPSPPRFSARSMKVFHLRGDKTKKDVVVTANDVIRNRVQIHQRYLEPDGLPYDTVVNIYRPAVYNFLKDFHDNFTGQQKQEFLLKTTVEIRVEIPEDYENPNIAKEKPKVTKVTVQANTMGKENETDESPKKYSFSTTTSGERTVLDTLNELGTEFANNTKNLTVTLVFPRDPTTTTLNTAINLAPVEGAPVGCATFNFLDKLCHYIDDNFSAITNLTVCLRVPSNTRMPLSMPQLYYVLPFYDLKFTNWYLVYLPDNLTNALKVEGWCVGMLDRERDRVVIKRMKKKQEDRRKIDNAIFVTPSAYVPEVKVRQGEVKKVRNDAGGGR
ncbi:uncharacterized protein PAC_06569 [Phialocephala subalpina]|uniref:Uncharacterized protein n=1 Tax=Phialocephala subalpina TaxID=576137 RepID=A0A1L7WV79_9HELO|nr:uncharacterized protein PAC_06569 [Phialocephala subalpina]